MSKHKASNTLWEYTKSFGVAILLAFVIKTSIVEAYKIPSGSMEDTLLVGDFLLANKFLYGARIPLISARLPGFRSPEQGDVVIFKFPRDPSVNYIKRCVAVGGQTVTIRNKQLFVDGKRVDLPDFGKFTSGGRGGSPRDDFGPYRVPPDHYFMMGDNRDNSHDSRFWGPVHDSLVLGKAMLIHWSWAPDTNAPKWEWNQPLAMGHAFFYNIGHFHQRVRWGRLADLIG